MIRSCEQIKNPAAQVAQTGSGILEDRRTRDRSDEVAALKASRTDTVFGSFMCLCRHLDKLVMPVSILKLQI